MRNSIVTHRIAHLEKLVSTRIANRPDPSKFTLTKEEVKRRIRAMLETGYVVETENGFVVNAATPAEDRAWAERFAEILNQ